MRFKQPEGFDFRWVAVVVGVGVVLITVLSLYWMSTATHAPLAQ